MLRASGVTPQYHSGVSNVAVQSLLRGTYVQRGSKYLGTLPAVCSTLYLVVACQVACTMRYQ